MLYNIIIIGKVTLKVLGFCFDIDICVTMYIVQYTHIYCARKMYLYVIPKPSPGELETALLIHKICDARLDFEYCTVDYVHSYTDFFNNVQ